MRDVNVKANGRLFQVTTGNMNTVFVKDLASGRVVGDAMLYTTKRAGWRWALNLNGKLSSRRARGETLGDMAREIIAAA